MHYSCFGYDINPRTVLPLIPSLRTDRDLTNYPHESFFLDGFLASGIFEDYGKENPLTRSEYKQAVVGMNKLFRDKYRMVVGMEWGADYGVPTTAYAHGMTTLHRMLYRSKDRRNRNSIYYVDAIVTTWRWDDANHHMPEIWWKKDLFNMLYGTAPVWTIDKPRWDKFKQTFVESYQTIGPWLEQIGYDEMLSHRFVTANHKVQETSFSSGKKAVVNFGDEEYVFEGKTIKPRSFIIKQ